MTGCKCCVPGIHAIFIRCVTSKLVIYRIQPGRIIVPKKIRNLIKMLKDAGFVEIRGGGKGAHRKFTHQSFPGAVTISGNSGDDAKAYQSNQVKHAIERIKE